MVGGQVVQVGVGGNVRIGPAGLVPALAQDPVTGRRLTDPLSQPLAQVGQRGRVCQGQSSETERPIVEVEVSVGQAGQRQAAAQVNQPGVGPSQGPDVGVTPDSQKPIAVDGKCGGMGEVGVLSK